MYIVRMVLIENIALQKFDSGISLAASAIPTNSATMSTVTVQ